MLILKADGLQIRPNVKTYLFANGVMEGTGATFVMSNGDIFTGEFRNDRFYKGRYIIKSDGSYFEGTFKNGQPDAGAWYDKNGNRL